MENVQRTKISLVQDNLVSQASQNTGAWQKSWKKKQFKLKEDGTIVFHCAIMIRMHIQL